MRPPVKVLANFLGAAKELTAEYADLAEITEDELDQMRLGLLSRERRKPTVKLLSAKGLSTRQIAEVTGWSHVTISRDLAVSNGTKSVSNETAKLSKTGGKETKQRRAKVAAAAKDGVTATPPGRIASE